MWHLERLSEGIIYVPTLKLGERERATVDESLVERGVEAAIDRYVRTIPLPSSQDSNSPLFFNRRTGQPLSRRALQNIWRVYAEKAGVAKSIHAGRHLAATEAIKHGGLKLAKRKLRHRSLSSTLVYEDIDFERERELLEKTRVV